MITPNVNIAWLVLVYISIAAAFQQTPLFDHDTAPPTTSPWKLNFSSEAPHYFASVYGLLQQWPNTFFPNGHSIVPCEIPAFTKLYHGRMDAEIPPSPEWVAFDVEMSYGIMGSTRQSHMLTYQTTRRAKCIYFDGESATLFGTGQLDSQMLQIFGNLTGPVKPGDGFRFLWDEYARAEGLCDWIHNAKLGGLGWGYEGIVRMNAGFEMIWCNFSSPSIRLVSHLNVSTPLLRPGDVQKLEPRKVEAEVGNIDHGHISRFPLPTPTSRSDKSTEPTSLPGGPNIDWDLLFREPFLSTKNWRWYTSSVQHYGSSGDGPGLGETRVKLNTCGFLNYYDPIYKSAGDPRAREEQNTYNLTKDGLWTGPGSNGTRSTALESLTRRRRLHTLENITSSDASVMKFNSERVMRAFLNQSSENCSGVDWSVLTNEIVQTYASSLSIFLKTLDKFDNLTMSNHSLIRNWMTDVREQTHAFLLPFLRYPEDMDEHVWTRNSTLFRESYSLCRFQHTRLLDPEEGIILSPEEILLKWAVEETVGSVCSVLIEVGFTAEGLWQSKFDGPSDAAAKSPSMRSIKKEVHHWKNGIEELMAWLGWAGEWVGCDRKCAWDETCYIPMWPLIHWGGSRPRRPYGPRYGYPGNPGYGTPGYGRPPPDFGNPSNGTGHRPGGSFWGSDEQDLWEPKCVKADYLRGS